MRIVALLISFAGPALLASCASYPVRCFVLAILRHAEATARLYALDASVPALAPIRICRDGVNQPAELATFHFAFGCSH